MSQQSDSLAGQPGYPAHSPQQEYPPVQGYGMVDPGFPPQDQILQILRQIIKKMKLFWCQEIFRYFYSGNWCRNEFEDNNLKIYSRSRNRVSKIKY